MTYPTCKDCGEPMRAAREHKRDHPGTVSHRADGQCQKCRRRAIADGRVEARKPRPEACEKCERPLVSSNDIAPPGFARYGAHGLCNSCMRAAVYRAKRPPKKPVVKVKGVKIGGPPIRELPEPGTDKSRRDRANLDWYWAERRKRIARVKRLADMREGAG